jgi:nicotinate-nucleotide--dimethylbenzimidazole phosphoribosyltransferase
VGARPLPVAPEHARVPARPLDAAAMDEARAAGRTEGAAWLAGCRGVARPAVRSRVVVLEGEAVPPVLPVPEVAAAVDWGRALAARSAEGGVTVLAAEVVGHRIAIPACALAALLTGRDPVTLARGGQVRAVEQVLERHAGELGGPLSALRRLGGEAFARACGMALGAGEHGLAFVADGLGATVAAALALRIEPGLAPRVRTAGAGATAAEAALALPPLLDGPAGATAALAALRRWCAE